MIFIPVSKEESIILCWLKPPLPFWPTALPIYVMYILPTPTGFNDPDPSHSKFQIPCPCFVATSSQRIVEVRDLT